MMIIKTVMFYFRFGSVISLIGGEERVIKSAGTVDSVEIIIIYGTPQKNLCTRTDQLATALPNAEVRLSLTTNVSSKY